MIRNRRSSKELRLDLENVKQQGIDFRALYEIECFRVIDRCLEADIIAYTSVSMKLGEKVLE